jgi:hypothetical protein
MIRTHALAAAVAAIAVASPRARADDRVSQAREVPGTFTRVKVAGPFDLTVREGSPAAVVVKAIPANQEKVRVERKDDVLVVDAPDAVRWGDWPAGGRPVELSVTLPELRGVEVAGPGEARAETGPAPRDLALTVGGSGSIAWKGSAAALAVAVSGSGSVRAEGSAQRLEVSVSGSGDAAYAGKAGPVAVSISGSGDVTLAGEGESLRVSTAGSGDVEAGGFAVRDATVEISGSGDAALRLAGGTLTVRIAGSGDVVWGGEARAVDARASGSGSVTRR